MTVTFGISAKTFSTRRPFSASRTKLETSVNRAHWRRDKTVDPVLRALVRLYEYEDWPRGRIVFGRARDLYILYADRKLLTRAMIARIETQFHLPAERTEVKGDFHYQSNETPKVL
jgi:hypothetical protein